MNVPTQIHHPEVEWVVDRLIESALAHSMPFALPTWTPDECFRYTERGARLPTLGSDLHYLGNGARASVSGIRSLVQEASMPAAR
jgi:2-keto-3-deoxy-L-rhamnonate aldolase RhmA